MDLFVFVLYSWTHGASLVQQDSRRRWSITRSRVQTSASSTSTCRCVHQAAFTENRSCQNRRYFRDCGVSDRIQYYTWRDVAYAYTAWHTCLNWRIMNDMHDMMYCTMHDILCAVLDFYRPCMMTCKCMKYKQHMTYNTLYICINTWRHDVQWHTKYRT